MCRVPADSLLRDTQTKKGGGEGRKPQMVARTRRLRRLIRQHLSTTPTHPPIAGKYKKNPTLRKQNEPPHDGNQKPHNKQPQADETPASSKYPTMTAPLMPICGGVKKSEGANSLQIRSKDHMTEINHRRQSPHAAPGTIHPIVFHDSRLLAHATAPYPQKVPPNIQ